MRLAVAVAVLLTTTPALGDGLTRARQHVRNIELPQARQELARVMAGRLTADELALALATQALLLHIDGDTLDLDTALRQLASFRPHYRFATDVPPEVTERFDVLSAVGPLVIEVERRADVLGSRLAVRVENDPGGLVRELVVHVEHHGVRVRHHSARRSSLDVSLPIGATFFVEARGPGGARVGQRGDSARRSDTRTSRGARWGLATGSVAVVLSVAAGLLVGMRPRRTNINAPIVRIE